MANPISTINFFCVCVTVTTTRQNLWTLVLAAFNTAHAADLANFLVSQRASTLSVKSAKSSANTVFIGDSTLVASLTVPVGVRDELDGGDSMFEPYQGGGPITIDISDLYVQTATGTGILYVSARRV